MANGASRPKDQGRNLVVCCDGTSNEISVLLSNVLKLYRIVEKSDRQRVYYHPGIGTIAVPDGWGRWRQAVRSRFEMATGRGLDRDVLNAYCFLCREYQPGDRIFLFGFSRGAYTVRVVAGMVYLIGLLRSHQVNFAGYALKAYKRAKAADNYELALSFTRTVGPQCVPIRFMGVWDTVSSVLVPGRLPLSRFRLEDLPYTSVNPAVQVFRQAIAIDEFRRMFRIKRWEEPQEYKPNRYSQRRGHEQQDCRQVWFAGCHGDIGGGYPELDSALSKYPLLWMLEQAKSHGLKVRTQMVNHLVKGHHRSGARDYTKPDASGKLHKSLRWPWWLLEAVPKSSRLKDWPRRKSLFGYYIPMAEPRFIPENSLIHTSVVERMRKLEDDYQPANFPKIYRVEARLRGTILTRSASTATRRSR